MMTEMKLQDKVEGCVCCRDGHAAHSHHRMKRHELYTMAGSAKAECRNCGFVEP